MHVEIVQNAKKDKGLYRNITKVNILYNKSDFYTIISLNFRLGDVRMKFKEFEYMRAIEAKKSITKAAQMLNVSQPAISRCLINLEKELGIQLFEKIDGRLCFNTCRKNIPGVCSRYYEKKNSIRIRFERVVAV